MFEMILSVLTGGATGILGSLLSSGLKFLDLWAQEKKADGDHKRTMEMHRLQAELKAEDDERALEAMQAQAAADLKTASYQHDMSLGKSSRWVTDILRLIRPALTLILVALIGVIYWTVADFAMQQEIVSSTLYMASTAVLWWFGDRAVRK